MLGYWYLTKRPEMRVVSSKKRRSSGSAQMPLRYRAAWSYTIQSVSGWISSWKISYSSEETKSTRDASDGKNGEKETFEPSDFVMNADVVFLVDGILCIGISRSLNQGGCVNRNCDGDVGWPLEVSEKGLKWIRIIAFVWWFVSITFSSLAARIGLVTMVMLLSCLCCDK